MWHFTKMDNQKRELANKDESTAIKWKVITLEIKYESRIKGIIEKIADCGNVDIVTVQGTVAVQSEELGKGVVTDANEESDCDKKEENVLEDVKLAENFTTLKGQRIKCWKQT